MSGKPNGSVGDLFLGADKIEKPFLYNAWSPLLMASFGFGAVAFANFATRRPVLSGIQKHVGAAILFGTLGIYLERKRQDHYSERDAILRHYIELHPEDFPRPDRKKFSQVLMEWVPVR